ncbi:hypothetical protein BC829DRAFT_393197 [Chytridium lagenaria]|nr:hypothetical protein BC829DRAFT_408709 [Chytridium lagenaria]KAI8848857.1 hypothetical protein BC829DRAFT_393197 [Chytridium lagenaria]
MASYTVSPLTIKESLSSPLPRLRRCMVIGESNTNGTTLTATSYAATGPLINLAS